MKYVILNIEDRTCFLSVWLSKLPVKALKKKPVGWIYIWNFVPLWDLQKNISVYLFFPDGRDLRLLRIFFSNSNHRSILVDNICNYKGFPVLIHTGIKHQHLLNQHFLSRDLFKQKDSQKFPLTLTDLQNKILDVKRY